MSRDSIPQAEIDAERDILSRQDDVLDKPEQVREKMVAGRLEKWFEAQVLVDQAWIHDSDLLVGDVLQKAGLEIIEFERFALAE